MVWSELIDPSSYSWQLFLALPDKLSHQGSFRNKFVNSPVEPAFYLQICLQKLHPAGMVLRRLRFDSLIRASWNSIATRPIGGTAGGTMGIAQILASIDHQIAQLERARALLGGAGTGRKGRGTGHAARVQSTRKKRKLTPEGRKRIAEAVKRRWEKQRKAAAAGQS
jgi:hypothetical protein